MRRIFAFIFLTNTIAGCMPQSEVKPLTVSTATEVVTETSNDNYEMVQIFEADQAIRKRMTAESWQDPKFLREMIDGDKARREQVRELLEKNALQTGADFYHAAYVFQHGNLAEDYLLAHTLATLSAAKGYERSTYIAAATLDRYLMNIDQPQIYGTQMITRDGKTMMEPYNSKLVPDALRQALGVPSLAAQKRRLAEGQKTIEK